MGDDKQRERAREFYSQILEQWRTLPHHSNVGLLQLIHDQTPALLARERTEALREAATMIRGALDSSCDDDNAPLALGTVWQIIEALAAEAEKEAQ